MKKNNKIILQYLQNEAKRIVNYYCKKYKLKPISIKVKNLKGPGRTRWKTRFISIPTWSYVQGGLDFFKAYILHEIAHFIMDDIFNQVGHNIGFINMEINILKRNGLVPLQYRRAYYNRLEDKNGKLLWVWKKVDRKREGLKDYKIYK